MAPLLPTIRPATEGDAAAIRRLVGEARLNPRDLAWSRFVVAVEGASVVACAQVRAHGGGTRELASVAVTGDRRGRGIGRAIAEAAIAREPVRPLYLFTESRTEAFWERFGFRTIEGEAIPRDMRGSLRIARVAMAAYSLVVRPRLRLVVMQRDAA